MAGLPFSCSATWGRPWSPGGYQWHSQWSLMNTGWPRRSKRDPRGPGYQRYPKWDRIEFSIPVCRVLYKLIQLIVCYFPDWYCRQLARAFQLDNAQGFVAASAHKPSDFFDVVMPVPCEYLYSIIFLQLILHYHATKPSRREIAKSQQIFGICVQKRSASIRIGPLSSNH